MERFRQSDSTNEIQHIFFFPFNIKVTFYLVLLTQYNLGFTEEGYGQMSDEANNSGPWKSNFLCFMG